MSTTIGNYTWSDTTGLTAAKDGTNIGLRCAVYYTFDGSSYGSCYAFFNISYTPLSDSKLRVKIDSIQLRQDTWRTRNWSVSGSVKVNNSTLFSGSLSTPSGTEYSKNTNIAVGGSYYVDIDYPDSQGSLDLNYDFSLEFVTYIYSTAWKGWTNGGKDTCSTGYSYSHTHSWSSSITTQPTCTEEGIRTYSCSSCESKYTEPVEVLGHTWDEGVIIKNPTYETTGIKLHTCEVCSTTKEEVEGKLPATIYIDNGSGFDGYGVYIDNGSSWDAYAVYIDDGEKFVAYC